MNAGRIPSFVVWEPVKKEHMKLLRSIPNFLQEGKMALIQMAEYIESLGMEDLVSIVVPDHDFQNRVLYLLHGMMQMKKGF